MKFAIFPARPNVKPILRTGRRAADPQGPAADSSQCTAGNGFGLVLHKLCAIFLKVLNFSMAISVLLAVVDFFAIVLYNYN